MTTDVSSTSETHLRILLANEREEDLRALGDVLEGLGHEVTPFAVSVAEATELIAREDRTWRSSCSTATTSTAWR